MITSLAGDYGQFRTLDSLTKPLLHSSNHEKELCTAMLSSTLLAVVLIHLTSPEVTAEELDAPPRPDWSRPCTVLNGPWRFDFDPQDAGEKENWQQSHTFSKSINVPFPWQSELSGIHDTEYQGAVWYQRDITIPKNLLDRRVFLVFGAVDYQAKVWLNNTLIAEHEGGYTPFEAEITSMVKPGQTATVTVRAYDVADPETPTGKQTDWYTRSGGIWQTPYLEYRGLSFLRKARITPDIDKAQTTFACDVEARDAGTYTVEIHAVLGSRHLNAKQSVTCHPGANTLQLILPVRDPVLWSPDSPSLYETRITLNQGGKAVDEVDTYFGMRKVSRGVYGDAGHEYILLNNKPIYLRGALHQSFNPKGIYTHPNDDFIRNDYAKAKEFGLNFIRIHIKIDEPRALYWADRLGVLLMCDMPNFTKNTPLAHQRWEAMLRAAVERDFNHPAIFAWCDFNETWGIGDGGYTPETQQWVSSMYRLTKELDPTRLAEDNSPCRYDHTETDINSWHFYIDRYEAAAKHVADVVARTAPGSEFNYAKGWKQDTAPLINSEYGGVSAGSGDRDISWVFLFLTNLLRKYDKVNGYVYTELEDIEWEHNGLMNYDRSPKEFGYPAGITLPQLQGDDFPVLDCPPYQRVDAHAHVAIPVLLSHWRDEQKGAKVRISVDGSTLNGLPWSNAIHPVEWDVNAKPFAVTPVNTFEFTLPGANGILNVVAEVLVNGERRAANYCVIDARGGGDWFRGDEYAATFPVNAFSAYGFKDMLGIVDNRPGKVFGLKSGFFEYQIRLPRGLRAEDIKGCRLIAEAGAKADSERLDWPARRNAHDYPQTDTKAWPTDLTVSINGMAIKDVTIGNDYADARGVLSHAANYAHGSHGELLDIPFEGTALTALRQAIDTTHTVKLRFEVKPDAAHQGGLALYGADMGMLPSDPALVFQLVPGADKPEKPAKVLAAKGLPFTTLIERGPNGHAWRYTTDDPGKDWNQPGFDDKTWKTGKSGFGTTGAPGARIGTEWKTNDIWLRSEVTGPKNSQGKPLLIDLYHDEDAEIFVNGALLLSKEGHVSAYERISLTPEQASLLKPGTRNLVAVHCHQTTGGQFIDMDLKVMK